MKDIKKPEFMKAAMQARSHNAVLELLIALIVLFVGQFLVSMLQVPMMVVYLLGNADYREMMLNYSVDLQRITKILQNTPDWFILANLFLEIGLVVIFLVYCRLFERRKANTLGFRKKGCIFEYIKGLLIGAAAFIAAYAICILTGSVNMNVGTITGANILYVIGFFGGYLIQGMAEEVICRGYFMVSLTRRYHVSTAVILSAVLFSLLHSSNPGISFLAYMNIFLFGIFLSLLFIRYENIWIVGAAHSMWNFLQGNVFGVQVSGMSLQPSLFESDLVGSTWINGGSFGLEGGFAVTVVLLLANALVLRGMSKHGFFVEAEPVDNPHDRAAREKRALQQGGYQGNAPGNGQNIFSQNRSQQQPGETGRNMEQEAFRPQGGEMQQAGQPEEKKGEYENMGLNPEETPWRPEEAWEQEDKKTAFDQSYFKD